MFHYYKKYPKIPFQVKRATSGYSNGISQEYEKWNLPSNLVSQLLITTNFKATKDVSIQFYLMFACMGLSSSFTDIDFKYS